MEQRYFVNPAALAFTTNNRDGSIIENAKSILECARIDSKYVLIDGWYYFPEIAKGDCNGVEMRPVISDIVVQMPCICFNNHMYFHTCFMHEGAYICGAYLLDFPKHPHNILENDTTILFDVDTPKILATDLDTVLYITDPSGKTYTVPIDKTCVLVYPGRYTLQSSKPLSGVTFKGYSVKEHVSDYVLICDKGE